MEGFDFLKKVTRNKKFLANFHRRATKTTTTTTTSPPPPPIAAADEEPVELANLPAALITTNSLASVTTTTTTTTTTTDDEVVDSSPSLQAAIVRAAPVDTPATSSSSSITTTTALPRTVAPIYPSGISILIPAGTTIFFKRPANMEGHDEEYGVNQFPGDASSIFFTTPTVLDFPSNTGFPGLGSSSFEETPIRPRRSKRCANAQGVAKTPAPLFQALGSSDIKYHVEGTLFENLSPMKSGADFNMGDFLNWSPEKQVSVKTPATRLAASRLNEVVVTQTPLAKEFVFTTPAAGLKWGGNEENRHPTLFKTSTKSFDPRVLQQDEEDQDDNILTPLPNAKARSKPFSSKMNERSPKRQCSGELTPRVPLQDLDTTQNRASISSGEPSELDDGDENCLVLSSASRMASTAYRNFTAIDLNTLKSFSPANKVVEVAEEPEAKVAERPRSSNEASQPQPKAAGTSRTIPTPSKIPIVVNRRRRGTSEPPAPESHFSRGEALISPATKRHLKSSYRALNATDKLASNRNNRSSTFKPSISGSQSTLLAPTFATSLKIKPPVADEKKLHRRSNSEPKAVHQPVQEPVHVEQQSNLSTEDVEMLDSDEFKALPDSVVELKKLVLQTQAKLKGEVKARKRAEETIDYMKVERDYYVHKLNVATQQAPPPTTTSRKVTQTASSRMVSNSTVTTTTTATATTETTRSQSSLGTRATRPPVQGTAASRSTGAAQRPPSRGTTSRTASTTNNTSTSARPSSRTAGGVSSSSSSRLNAVPARPNSALSRQPVRRK